MDKKALINEYKQRKITGGIYKVTNTNTGSYLLDYAADIQSIQNRFDFMVSSGSCFNLKLKKDWETYGAGAFTLEVLETIEKKKEQSQADFIDDLKTLKQLWSEKLDSSNRY